MTFEFCFILTILRRNHNNQWTDHGQSRYPADVDCQRGAAFNEYKCVEFIDGNANNPSDTTQ